VPNRVRPQAEIEFPQEGSIDTRTQSHWLGLGEELMERVRAVVQASPDKQGAGIAADLNVKPSQFSDALAGNGKHFSVKWLPRTMKDDREHRIAGAIATFAGQELRPKRLRNPRRVAHLMAQAFLAHGEAGIVQAAKFLGPEATKLLDACLADPGEDL
jgi:hypothetical protein